MRFAERLSPLNRRRVAAFVRNRRGFLSLWVFLALFALSLLAEVIANDRPLLVRYDGALYAPVLRAYPETTFGGDFETEADYRDPFVRDAIEAKGWIVWPAVPFAYNTVSKGLGVPFPAPIDTSRRGLRRPPSARR